MQTTLIIFNLNGAVIHYYSYYFIKRRCYDSVQAMYQPNLLRVPYSRQQDTVPLSIHFHIVNV